MVRNRVWVGFGGAGAVVGLVLLAACTPPAPPEISGRALFAANCVGCHGVSARGDGPAASGLPKRPADLTRIAARNGGDFPTARVMSTINGYFRPGSSVMPHFGDVTGGPTVLVDSGDGIMTPAPEGLVALADYLRSVQRP